MRQLKASKENLYFGSPAFITVQITPLPPPLSFSKAGPDAGQVGFARF
jgi:hypothetical protein